MVLDYAFEFWIENFKDKYEGYDIDNLLAEKEYFYRDSLDVIFPAYYDYRNGIYDGIRILAYDISEELHLHLQEYVDIL